MNKLSASAVIAAALLSIAAARAEPPPAPATQARPAAEAAEPARARSFKQDVKDAWSQARRDARRAGRAIGDGARAFGRATRDTAVDGWRKVKDAFAS